MWSSCSLFAALDLPAGRQSGCRARFGHETQGAADGRIVTVLSGLASCTEGKAMPTLSCITKPSGSCWHILRPHEGHLAWCQAFLDGPTWTQITLNVPGANSAQRSLGVDRVERREGQGELLAIGDVGAGSCRLPADIARWQPARLSSRDVTSVLLARAPASIGVGYVVEICAKTSNIQRSLSRRARPPRYTADRYTQG